MSLTRKCQEMTEPSYATCVATLQKSIKCSLLGFS